MISQKERTPCIQLTMYCIINEIKFCDYFTIQYKGILEIFGTHIFTMHVEIINIVDIFLYMTVQSSNKIHVVLTVL